MQTTKELLDFIVSRLTIENDVKEFESKVIASHILGLDFSDLLINKTIDMSEKKRVEIERVIDQRNSTMPLAYVLKSTSFRELDLYVDQRVLIPRPETELLTQYVLDALIGIENPKVLDIGVGSGAVSLSIAHENKNARVVGVDISEDALHVARLNMVAVGSSASRVTFKHSDLFQTLDDTAKFDVVVSNPPYVAKNDDIAESVTKFEPHVALYSDDGGLDHIHRIIRSAKDFLKPGGLIFLEIGETQAERVTEIAQGHGYRVETIKDLTSKDRFIKLS